jgi:siroheme synthase (precorrin-2 oxidase/ferrochelatase)
MGSEIKLNGGEITLLKKIGLSGAPVYGKILRERTEEMLPAEFLDTLTGLMEQGYVLSDKVSIRLLADVETAFFRVDGAHAKELRDAVNPSRRRNEERTRRQRRR